MKGGDWIWIIVIAFGLFRLLMLTRKKKEDEKPRPGTRTVPPQKPPSSKVDPLKAFFDSLADKYEEKAGPVITLAPEPEEFEPEPRIPPKPPPMEKVRIDHPRPLERAPRLIDLPVRKEVQPSNLHFAANPIIQGIILAEILGPPRGLRGGTYLPSDYIIK